MRGATLEADQVLKIRRDLDPIRARMQEAKAAYAEAIAQASAEHDLTPRHIRLIVSRKVWKELYDKQQLFRKLDVKESSNPRRRVPCCIES